MNDELKKDKENRSKMLAIIQEKIAHYHISPQELEFKDGVYVGKNRKIKMMKYGKCGKYWDGTGATPSWVSEHINAGGILDELLFNIH